MATAAETASQTQQDYVNQLYGLTQPLRTATVNRLRGILTGGIPISALPEYAPARAAIEGQFGTAEKQLMSALPRGGVLQSSLADLIAKRAGAVSTLSSDLLSQAQNQAAQIGFGYVPTAISGMGTSASTQANIAAQKAAQTSANYQNIGTGLGLLAALIMGGIK